jgi:hypothetical protein
MYHESLDYSLILFRLLQVYKSASEKSKINKDEVWIRMYKKVNFSSI